MKYVDMWRLADHNSDCDLNILIFACINSVMNAFDARNLKGKNKMKHNLQELLCISEEVVALNNNHLVLEF